MPRTIRTPLATYMNMMSRVNCDSASCGIVAVHLGHARHQVLARAVDDLCVANNLEF